jgi:hypothetical protein
MLRDTWTRVASTVAFVVAIALAGSAHGSCQEVFAPYGPGRQSEGNGHSGDPR